ncbi:MAG: alpha/beta hydrolase [Gammaproteobacteria bacterium]|nr:alpha/beta hydrolase [Gammaproteobacteria bacterium]
MFRVADIDVLRNSLQEIDFRSEKFVSFEISRYLNHYGLNADSLFLRQSSRNIHQFGYFPCAGFRIACHYFSPPPEEVSGTAFIVHGYYDHAGLYGHLIEYCLSKNLAVVIFDLPGHGLSTGEVARIDSFGQYREVFSACLRLAKTAGLKTPWRVLGQSTGAAIVMDTCLATCEESLDRFESITLLAPLVRPQGWLRGSLVHSLLEPFVETVARKFVDNSNDEEFLRFQRESDPLQSKVLSARWVGALKQWLVEFEKYSPCPVRISVVQGAEDTTVDWRYNLKAIERKFPNVTTYMIAEARHHLANESADIRERLYSILDDVF